MPNFIMIENNSGYVWGQIDATTALEACQKLDAEIDPGNAPADYTEEFRPDFANESGYHVYDGTGFDIDAPQYNGGDDEALIAAVLSLPKMGYFRAAGSDE